VGLRAVAFSSCGQRLAMRGFDGAVILWDARTGEEEHRFQGFPGDACCMDSGEMIRVIDGCSMIAI